MNDHDENYQQPEDDALEFWMWCEEQMELENDLEIEILPEDER